MKGEKEPTIVHKQNTSERITGHLHPECDLYRVALFFSVSLSSLTFWVRSHMSLRLNVVTLQLWPSVTTDKVPSSSDWSNETTPLAVNGPALPRALFLVSQCRSSRLGAGQEGGRGRERKAARPFWQARQGWAEGTRFIWLFQWFQSRQPVTWLPHCTETFFVCTQLWEVNKVVYPVFGKRVRCTALLLVPLPLLPPAWQTGLVYS